jgi:hypothetical protein
MPKMSGIETMQQAEYQKHIPKADVSSGVKIIGILGFDGHDRVMFGGSAFTNATAMISEPQWIEARKQCYKGSIVHSMTDPSMGESYHNMKIEGPRTIDVIAVGAVKDIIVEVRDAMGNDMICDTKGINHDGTGTSNRMGYTAMNNCGAKQIHINFERMRFKTMTNVGGDDFADCNDFRTRSQIYTIVITVIKASPHNYNYYSCENIEMTINRLETRPMAIQPFTSEARMQQVLAQDCIPYISSNGQRHGIANIGMPY